MYKLIKSISQIRGIIFMPKNGTDVIGKPNSYKITMSKKDKTKPHSIRHFDSTGKVDIDIDCNDHGNSDKHNYPKHNGAHKHIWNPNRQDQEPLTDEEYEYYVLNYKKLK